MSLVLVITSIVGGRILHDHQIHFRLPRTHDMFVSFITAYPSLAGHSSENTLVPVRATRVTDDGLILQHTARHTVCFLVSDLPRCRYWSDPVLCIRLCCSLSHHSLSNITTRSPDPSGLYKPSHNELLDSCSNSVISLLILRQRWRSIFNC